MYARKAIHRTVCRTVCLRLQNRCRKPSDHVGLNTHIARKAPTTVLLNCVFVTSVDWEKSPNDKHCIVAYFPENNIMLMAGFAGPCSVFGCNMQWTARISCTEIVMVPRTAGTCTQRLLYSLATLAKMPRFSRPRICPRFKK